MTELIYGGYGSGKTTEIFNRIKEDTTNKKSCFLIIPDQEAVVFERLSLRLLPPSSQLYLETLAFSRLYNRVCREYGGLSYSYVTKPMRALLMNKTLRELVPLLSEYGKLINDPSIPDLMISTINELKASGNTASDLEIAAKKFKPGSPLANRIHDISLIYACYDKFVAEKYSDSADDLTRLRDILKAHNFFADSCVYIDSFTSFTSVQLEIIDLMIKNAQKVVITVPATSLSSETISQASILRSALKLRNIALKRGTLSEIVLRDNKRSKSAAITYLVDNLWKLEKSTADDAPSINGDIVCEICHDPYAEAQAVASHIRKLLVDGARCRDIAIVMRDTEKYRGIIEPALKNAGVPFFMSDKSDLCSAPAVKFLLSALKIKRYNWQKNDVISHLKTGLCNIEPHDANLFEEYVTMWNIHGDRFLEGEWNMNPDGFVPEISDRGQSILSSANKVRNSITEPLLRFFVLLDASKNIADMCRAVYRYLCEVQLEEKLNELSHKAAERGDIKQAQELSRIFSIMLSALADIGEILGESTADTEEFTALIKTVFEKTEIGSIPTSIDEVTIGNAQMMRASDKKFAFIMGLCENEFPATVENSGIFSDTDRAEISAAGIEFSNDLDTLSSNELMYVERAFAIPSERLFLFTYSSEISGASRFPSLAFNRVAALFEGFEPHRYETEDLLYLIPSPKNAASILRIIKNSELKASLSKALEPHIPGISESVDLKASVERCQVSKETVSEIFGNSLYMSPSSFEKYVRCPFEYYCSNVLQLRERKTSDFQSDDMGSFIHYILENLIRISIPSKDGEAFPDDATLTKNTSIAVERYVSRICPPYLLNTARMKHLYERLSTLSLMLVKNIVEEFSKSEFKPMFFELKTDGHGSNPSPLFFRLDSGKNIFFSGTVDRVDLYKKDDSVYVRVVDYKTGTKVFSLDDIDKGMNLQMLIYLFALCKNRSISFKQSLESDSSLLPAGVMYLSSDIEVVELDDYTEYDDMLKRAANGIKRTGVLLNDENVLHAMNSDMDKKFLAGISQSSKDGSIKGDALTSSEHFSKAYDRLENIVKKIANEIFAGIADSAPKKFGKSIPCTYCKAKPICRKMNDIGGK